MTAKALIPILVAMMLLTGVGNTILTKYQDMQCVKNCNSLDPKVRKNFEQPVWQTLQMFIGEMGCWLVVAASALYRRFSTRKAVDTTEYQPVDAQARDSIDGSTEALMPGHEVAEGTLSRATPLPKPLAVAHPDRAPLRGWRAFLLAIPAACDLTGTTLMNVGLLFVAASIYQMTRGALVLFVGLFSVLFLGRRLPLYKWMALFVVTAGICIVGLAGAIQQKPAPLPGDTKPPPMGEVPKVGVAQAAINMVRAAQAGDDEVAAAAAKTVLGIALIFLAQIFTASQFVVEEAIMAKYTISPLAAVGYEGIFGFSLTFIVQIILNFAIGQTASGRGGFFDMKTGWHEMTSNTAVWVTSLLIMVSIGGFNFFGLSVTRTVSATSRSTIDTCRTLFIWVISLGLRWESFKWLQVVGFAGLVYGTFLFNDIVRPPMCAFLRRRTTQEPLAS